MILNEKGPYLLTILFASFAWTISQISIDIVKGPAIEVDTQVTGSKPTQVIYTITNISKEKLFKSLTFTIRIDKNSNAECTNTVPRLIIPPPTDSLKKNEESAEPNCSNKKAIFPNVTLHPGAKVQLVLELTENAKTNFYVSSQEAVRVLNTSLETKIIKYKFNILLTLFSTWAVLIVIYLYIFNKGINKTDRS